MALASEARRGKYISLPWLKHFAHSQPTDVLTNWILRQCADFTLLIFEGHNHTETTWLLHPPYQRAIAVKHQEFMERVLLSGAEVDDMSATFIYESSHAEASRLPRTRSIGLVVSPRPSGMRPSIWIGI
jgi:hypothetical protein